MNDAQKMWDSAIAIARAFTESPAYKAYLFNIRVRQKVEREREEAAAAVVREAREEADRKARAGRLYDMTGGGNECAGFGMMEGCRPWCPVFERGECFIQADNEAEFTERGWQ